MEIKALFIDIDGTLLNFERVIDEETKKSLLDFQRTGGKVVLSSARPYIGMKKYGDDLELSKYGGYYSAFNGGEIINATTLETTSSKYLTFTDMQTIFDLTRQLEEEFQDQAIIKINNNSPFTIIPKETALEIHKMIEKTHLNIMTYKENTLLMMRQEMYSVIEVLLNNMNMSVEQDFMKAIDFHPIKVLISGDPSLIKQAYPIMYNELSDTYDVITSDPFLIEVTPKGINKGNSLESLAKDLKIPLSQTAAFGDSMNDVSMLQKAGIGIAMGNATEQIKQIADFVTLSCDEHGIAYALQELL